MKEPTFKKLQNQIQKQLKSLEPNSITRFDFSKHDKLPLNYTINIFPSSSTLKKITKEITMIRDIDPRHFYYPPKEITYNNPWTD